MAKDNIKSSELNRYYTASDIAEHYGRKFGLKLKEIDVIKIMESQAPKSEQIGDGLYSRTANHNFEEYFRKYAESISGGVKAAKFSHEEPAMSDAV